MACVNQNTPQFQDLLYRTGLNADILAAMVGNYQRINGQEMFPTLEDLKLSEVYIKDEAFNPYTGYNSSIVEQATIGENAKKPIAYNFDMYDAISPQENFAININSTTNKKNQQYRGPNSLVLLKTNSRNAAANKLTLLNSAINQNRVNDLRKATEVQVGLENVIERLDAEIEKLSRMKVSVIGTLQPYIENELQYAEVLGNSDDFFDIQRAEDIIRFIQRLNDFTDLQNHPLFYMDEISDNNVVTIDPAARGLLDHWYNKAQLIKEKIGQQKLRKMKEFMDNDPTVQMTKKQIGEDALAQIDIGMKDITIVDQYFYGIGSNFLGKDHWIPVVTKRIYFEALQRESSKYLALKEEMEEIQPDVLRKLKALGETLVRYGIEVNSPTFEVFRRRTESGQKTTQMIRKHSQKWDDFIYDAIQRTKERIKPFEQTYKANPTNAFNNIVREIQDRNKKLQNNTEWFDLSKIPEVIDYIKGDSKYTEFESQLQDYDTAVDYRNEMIILMSEKQYQKTVEEQINKFSQFFETRDLEFDTNRVAEIAGKKTTMTKGVWDRKFSPFVNPFTMDISHTYKTVNFSRLNFHTLVPKRVNQEGNTGYYDAVYENVIESDSTLSRFYDIAETILNNVYDSFDESGRRLIQDPLFIPEQYKNLTDILYEGVAFNQKMRNLSKWFWDSIRKYWTGNQTNDYSTLRINQLTGEPSYAINQNFLRSNRAKFDSIYQITKKKFASVYSGIWSEEHGNQIIKAVAPLRRNQTINISRLNNVLLGMLNEYQGTPDWTIEQWRNKYGDEIPVSSIIYRYAQHQVAMETSFDLPRILLLYANLAAENAARHEVLPEAVMLKRKYEELKNTDNPDEITAEVRTRANARHGWWFDKHILNYSHNGKSILARVRDKLKPENPNAENAKIVMGQVRNAKTYDSFERGLRTEIDDFIAKNGDYITQEDITELQDIKNNMGGAISATAIMDSILNYIRLKALGWNLSSSLTNVFAGQLSNSLIGISGTYFPYEYLHTVNLGDLLRASFTSKFNKAWVDPEVKKAIAFFKKSDVKQDATNELQKATQKSILNSRWKEVSSPFWGIARGEDFNQIPLFVAYLRTKNIKGKDGNEVSVWDALESYDVMDENGKVIGWNTRLKENFATEQNIQNWENLAGQDYTQFRTQVEQLIIMGHGDFSNYSGMMVKEDILGRMVMMFKTWLPMEFHKRWATQQYDYTLGVNIKGRYRSHTSTTLGVQGALIGMFSFGPLGGLIGGSLGAVAGKYLSNRLPLASSEMQDPSGSIVNRGRNILDNLNESVILAQFLAKRIASFFINPVARTFTGKRPINVERVYYDGAWRSMDEALGVNGADFTQVDLANWKSNAQEIAMTLTYMALILIVKGLAYDEDDEPDSARRRIHNASINKLMQLAQETTMYLEPFDEKMGLKTTWSVGTFTWLENVGKTVASIADTLDGEDIYLAGPNAGKNKFMVNFNRTFVPGVFGSITRGVMDDRETDLLDFAGFAAISERQFQNTPIDKYFTPQKNADADVKNARMKRRIDLREQGVDEKDITKILNEELPTPKQQAAKEKRKRGNRNEEED